MKATSILAGLAFSMVALASTPASAQSSSAHEYAESQCANGRYAEQGFATYESCYDAAVQYYDWYVGSGGGGGGGGDGGVGGGNPSGGGGTWIPDIGGTRGCASRLKCFDIEGDEESEATPP